MFESVCESPLHLHLHAGTRCFPFALQTTGSVSLPATLSAERCGCCSRRSTASPLTSSACRLGRARPASDPVGARISFKECPAALSPPRLQSPNRRDHPLSLSYLAESYCQESVPGIASTALMHVLAGKNNSFSGRVGNGAV